MRKHGYGRIVNIASNVIVAGTPEPGPLRGVQGRRVRLHPRAGHGAGQVRHHGQLRGARPDGDRGHRGVARTPRRSTSCSRSRPSRAAAWRRTSRPRSRSSLARRRPGSRARCSWSTAATPATSRTGPRPWVAPCPERSPSDGQLPGHPAGRGPRWRARPLGGLLHPRISASRSRRCTTDPPLRHARRATACASRSRSRATRAPDRPGISLLAPADPRPAPGRPWCWRSPMPGRRTGRWSPEGVPHAIAEPFEPPWGGCRFFVVRPGRLPRRSGAAGMKAVASFGPEDLRLIDAPEPVIARAHGRHRARDHDRALRRGPVPVPRLRARVPRRARSWATSSWAWWSRSGPRSPR